MDDLNSRISYYEDSTNQVSPVYGDRSVLSNDNRTLSPHDLMLGVPGYWGNLEWDSLSPQGMIELSRHRCWMLSVVS